MSLGGFGSFRRKMPIFAGAERIFSAWTLLAHNLMGLQRIIFRFALLEVGRKAKKKLPPSGNEVVFRGSVQLLRLHFSDGESGRVRGQNPAAQERDGNPHL